MMLGQKCRDKATGLMEGVVVRFNNGTAIGRTPDGKLFKARGGGRAKKHRCRMRVFVEDVGWSEWFPGRWLTRTRAKIDLTAHPLWGGACLNVDDKEAEIVDL